MGDGSIKVGNKTPARKIGGSSGLPAGETNALGLQRPRICVAMTQQSGEFGRGTQSAPQKLLRLVGYRDPNARPVPQVRPRPAVVER